MRIAIYGYGNLGKGVEIAIRKNPDCELVGIFTKRPVVSITTLTATKVYSYERILEFRELIDVLIICKGSANDLPKETPVLAKHFNVIDSFDNHSEIPEHFKRVDKAAKEGYKTALISAGWDPGMFSLCRLYSSAILPYGKEYTFWGRGVSQGHSDAIRRINGVKDARQYTVPIASAIESVRNGELPELLARKKHKRECYVVANEDEHERIEREIKTMPDYFADYDTEVYFINEDEMKKSHSSMPHAGSVIYCGTTGTDCENKHTIEYKLNLSSNPQFTGSVLTAFARAVYRMSQRGIIGCKTVFDIAPADLSMLSIGEIIHFI